MFASHLKALLRKNWLMWKRNTCCSIFEILVPIIFALLLALFRNFSPLTLIPLTSHLNITTQLYPGLIPQPPPQQQQQQQQQQQIPQFAFKNCSGENGGFIALAPRGNPIINKLANLITTGNNLIKLAFANLINS